MADPFLNDGSIPYGSQVLTLLATTTATTGTAYIADNIDFSDPSKEINRTNQVDEPSGSVNYDDFQRATATLQLATTTTPLPTKGHVAQITVGAGETLWFFVYDRTAPKNKGEDHKCNVTFKRLYN
jgi:hypothetical protein